MWKFQVSQEVRAKTQTSRRDLSKIDEEKFNHDLNINLEIDTGKTPQQNYNYMYAIKKTMDKHAPLITKTKTKKITIHGSTRIHKGSRPNEGWLRKGGSNQNNMKTS